MATKVIMPKQGLQMTEGNIIQWLASEGESVTEGEPLFEMETDKLTIEIDAPASGVLLKIIHGEGAVVPITHTIGVIGTEGEDISDILAEADGDGESGAVAEAEPTPSESSSETALPSSATERDPSEGAQSGQVVSTSDHRPDGTVFSSPRARWQAEERGVDLSMVTPSGPEGMVIERDVLDAAAKMPAATPLARKKAASMGVSLSSVSGTGPRGKVYENDLQGSGAAPSRPVPAEVREDRLVPLTGMRKTIAQRMRDSLDTAAQAVHRLSVDMSETVRMRTKLKAAEIAVSYNDIILKATAQALRKHPRINSALTEEGVLEFGHVSVGVAVALEDGLIVPVIRNTDLLTLQEIHQESRRLGEAARNGSLTADEMQGGTFSVSNLGMYGLDSFTAIIDTPETGILAVGAIKERVVAVNGVAEVRPICELSLTYDHRVVDGAPAAEFLQSIAGTLENPYTLI